MPVCDEYRHYVHVLKCAVDELCGRMGLAPPSPSELYKRDDWVLVLEQRLAELQRGHRQLELHVQHLENQLLCLSASYEFIDGVCDVPMVPQRATDEAYVAALEHEIARLEQGMR